MQKNNHRYSGKAFKVPSLFCFMLVACANTTYAQKPTQDITYKGNVFELHSNADTVTVFDPVTTEVSTVIQNPNPIPVKLNNMHIYAEGDVDTEPSLTWGKLVRYIVQSSNRQISALGNGRYQLLMSNVIVNEQGKIVYYNFNGISKMHSEGYITEADNNNINATVGGSTNAQGIKMGWKKLDERTNKAMSVQVDMLMNKSPTYQPAKVQGNAVPYRLTSNDVSEHSFTIKNGAIYYN